MTPDRPTIRVIENGTAHAWDLYTRREGGFTTHELYRLVVVDERPDVDSDPTLAIYRSPSGFEPDLTEEPILQAKLRELK